MWDSRSLIDSEEIEILLYEKCMISLHIKDLETRLSMCCDFCGGYYCSTFCEEQYIVKEKEQEVVNIDYNTQLKNILDDFLMSNQVSFENFEVQCSDLVDKAYESQRKLVKMETECHKVVVEENPKVRSVDIFQKSEPTGIKEITHEKMDTCPSLRWESSNDKDLAAGAWEHLLLCAKFMEFLPNKRKKKDDIFFLSFLPP